MKNFSLVIALIGFFISNAQTHKATISSSPENGLHKIELPQNVRSANLDNSNYLRIKDIKGSSVPFVVVNNRDESFSEFKPLNIISNTQLKDSITSIILEKNDAFLDDIVLKIANTKINKSYTIYGSQDKLDWFGLISNRSLNNLNSNTKTFTEQHIAIPLNTYNFIKIDFNDKYSIPINILEIGTYQNSYFKQQPTQIKSFEKSSFNNEEQKTTELTFTAKNGQTIDVINFNIMDEYFLRDCKLTVTKERKINKHFETYNYTLKNFRLNSDNNNSFNVSLKNIKSFKIIINNEDNPPLDFKTVNFYQNPKYIVANLNKNTNYQLIIDSTLHKPNYDLKQFIPETLTNLNEASISNLTRIKKVTAQPKEKSFWETPLFMWICIAIGGLLVIYFSINLLKDVTKK